MMINQGASDFGEPKPDSAMNRRLAEHQQEVRKLEEARATKETKGPQEVSLVELRALAATVRQCQRNGHPDLSKHLEALLTKLGA